MAVLFVSQDVWLQKRSSQVAEPIVGPIANLAGVYSKQSSNAQLGATTRGVVESPSLGLEFEHARKIEKARLTGAPCFVVDPSGSVGFDAPPPT